MIILNYSVEEMKKALEDLGYTVRLEDISPDFYDSRDDDYTKRPTWMVYWGDQCVTIGTKFDRLYNAQRLEEIFEAEFKKRLLRITMYETPVYK